VTLTWEASTLITYQANDVGINGLSIMRPELLTGFEKSKNMVRVKGVGAVHKTKANVLCFVDAEDVYKITYVAQHSFTVCLTDHNIVFYRKKNVCCRFQC
jgi:hypothetical protein